MKNILVLVHEDEGQEARLQTALDVTRALSGHLTCLDVVVPWPVVPDEIGFGQAVVIQEAREHEDRNRAAIEKRLAKEDVPWSIARAFGDPAEALRSAAALADLVVVSSRSEKEGPYDARRVASELAVKCSRPVLAVPPRSTGLDIAGSVLVAWDGSHDVNQAMRTAVPLLQLAESVTLLAVNLPSGPFAMEDAASYLSRNGVHARLVEKSTKNEVAETIRDRARELGAAYIVMGAFGPGRAMEAIFGGVSRSMLEESDIPLLLAHA